MASIIPPEVFLIIPALNKRVESGKATPMELVAVAFLHDIQNMFSSDTSSKKESPNPSAPRPRGFSTAEVHQKFNQLADALPQLRDLDYLFEVLQIPAVAQRGLRGMWNAASSVQVCC